MSRQLGSNPGNSRTIRNESPNHIFQSAPARRWALLALAVLTVAAFSMIATQALPQIESSPTPPSTTQQQAVTPVPDPPGTIDGAKNPELIPDEVALRMIVLAVAEPANATDEQKARAQAKLNPIGLSDDDAASFLSLLADYGTHADAIDKQVAEVYVRAPIPHPDSTDYKLLLDLGAQKNQLVTDAVAAVPAKLSDDGLAKLGNLLPQAKKGMKIIPDMPMPK